ncbi:hypothetical protein [Thiolapillus brandeum]|uniref:Uncharacterized protein n=1 Tax=Thiolapillus brandeum TaxID=1076588 RepID=A0A7U6GJD6_9GAMM|nr:hypothetical protein [Thiolapillus brandeum]BAO44660.1 hypothetical protein TBH_C1743 [Thiolapillus brandeum]
MEKVDTGLVDLALMGQSLALSRNDHDLRTVVNKPTSVRMRNLTLRTAMDAPISGVEALEILVEGLDHLCARRFPMDRAGEDGSATSGECHA